jgi:hypothetical protein
LALQLLTSHVPFEHEAVPFWLEHATTLLQVVPQVDVDVRSISQPLLEMSSQLTVLVGQPVHIPATQVWLVVQATAWPHCPLALHGCTPLPEQLVCPGPQTPAQLAVAPDWTHVLLALQVESMLELRPLAAHFLTS